MAMTVRELIEALEQFDENMEVRLAEQPNWPFEYSIAGVVEFNAGCDDEDNPEDFEGETFVYIVEGTQLDYMSSTVWDMC